jgi:formylglycine-generating enzyme required for sulfatase activity
MGCDPEHNGGYLCDFDEIPLHTVYLSGYYIDRAEVTNARYKACVTAGACTPPSDFSSSFREEYYNGYRYSHYPVLYVDWFQAQAFCEWAGGSLPTEAQWEKAARGPDDTRAFPWGDDPVSCELANGRVNDVACFGDTTEIGSYSPAGDSPYGIYDLAGNVYEWLHDWYSPTYYEDSPYSNPPGPETGVEKLRRSGAFGSYPNFLRNAVRLPTLPTTSRGYIGFRCAYSP